MADKPSTPAATPTVKIAGSEQAPFVYFDGVSCFGINNGVIQIELATNTLIPEGTGVKVEFLQTAHLRCSPAAAVALRSAIDRVLQMLQQGQQQAAEPAPVSKH